jgi:hypothetical protein
MHSLTLAVINNYSSEEYNILGYDTTKSGRSEPMFQRKISELLQDYSASHTRRFLVVTAARTSNQIKIIVSLLNSDHSWNFGYLCLFI